MDERYNSDDNSLKEVADEEFDNDDIFKGRYNIYNEKKILENIIGETGETRKIN